MEDSKVTEITIDTEVDGKTFGIIIAKYFPEYNDIAYKCYVSDSNYIYKLLSFLPVTFIMKEREEGLHNLIKDKHTFELDESDKEVFILDSRLFININSMKEYVKTFEESILEKMANEKAAYDSNVKMREEVVTLARTRQKKIKEKLKDEFNSLGLSEETL